jgi:hypothetical protein
MYDHRLPENRKVILKFRNTEVTLALGCGYNPEVSEERNISKFMLTTPYLKYDGTWYHIKCGWKWNTLLDISNYLKKDVYSEEQFLDKLIQLISDD